MPVFAHHSAVAFDQSASITVTGKVTQFIWRNPHMSINMEVAREDGTTELWKIEGGATNALARFGFTKKTVVAGDEISVKVHPMRNGEPGGLLQGLSVADGTYFALDGSEASTEQQAQPQAIPSLVPYVPPPPGETWQTREKRTRPAQLPLVSNTGQEVGPGALDPENFAKGRPAAPFDMTGTWAFRGEDAERATYGSYEFKPLPEFTPKGREIYQEYLSFAREGKRYAEPTAECYPAGLPRIMTRYGSLMIIQLPTAIYMISRLNNEFRVIYLDGRAPVPSNIRTDTWGGESLGHWEGDTLVIETEGFVDNNHLMQQGVFAGNQLKVTERISSLNDNNTLMIEYSFVDPEHWVGEWKHTKFHDRILKSDVKEANCLYEDNLALPGL